MYSMRVYWSPEAARPDTAGLAQRKGVKPTVGKVLQQGLDPLDDDVQRDDHTADGVEEVRADDSAEPLAVSAAGDDNHRAAVAGSRGRQET